MLRMKALRAGSLGWAMALVAAVLLSVPASAQSVDSASRRREAARAMQEGRFEDAARICRELLKAQPRDIESRGVLAQASLALGRPLDAVRELRRLIEIAPGSPAAWFTLGHAYNAAAQDAMATLADRPEDAAWRQLLVADALMSDGRLTDAFALYRETLEQLPALSSIHESIARIYEQTGHPDWAARERASIPALAVECPKVPSGASAPQRSRGPALSEPQASRRAACEFRAGRYRAAFDAAVAERDAESRYWQARAASELGLQAFKRLDTLPDSRERREVHATLASAERRYPEAIAELKAALKFAPGDQNLLQDLGTAYYFARDYDKAVATLLPLIKNRSNDPQLLATCGDALFQLQRIEEAIPLLQRAADLDTSESGVRLSLARALIAKEYFQAAIPLLELDLPDDADGTVHVQLARAYKGLRNEEKAAQLMARSQELQKSAQERNAAKGQRAITPPK